MKGLCGADCSSCELLKNKKCLGCEKSKGCPFGKKCFIANYIDIGGEESFKEFKKTIIDEFNSLNIEGMGKIEELYPLNGAFINLEYLLPNGIKAKFLHDDEIYLGNQIECEFNDNTTKKCFGVVANTSFLLVSTYEENGANPELIIYKKR